MSNVTDISKFPTDEASSDFNLEAINALPDFDAAEHLNSVEAIAAYLNGFLEDSDPAMIAHALGTVARALVA